MCFHANGCACSQGGQWWRTVMGQPAQAAVLLWCPSCFLVTKLMFCPRGRAGMIKALLSTNPSVPGFLMPHTTDVGKLRGGWHTQKQISPSSPPPSGWCASRDTEQDIENPVQDVTGPLHQPVLDWPSTALPAMSDNTFFSSFRSQWTTALCNNILIQEVFVSRWDSH